MEQAARQRRQHQQSDILRAGRLPEDRDVVGIASEVRNVRLHPLQRGDLVHDAVIARGVLKRFRRQRRQRSEAENA